MRRAAMIEPMRPTPMKAIFSPTRPPSFISSLSAGRRLARIEIHSNCIGEAGTRRRIARQHLWVVSRNDMLRRTGERFDDGEGVEIGRDIVDDRKWAPL